MTSLSQDIVAVGQLMADNLNEKGIISADVNDGLTTLAGKIRNIVAAVPTLSINVPLNLIYSDNFNVSGTLVDANGNSISGASVKLKVGNTVVDTQTTNSNGLVSFTRSPVSMGTHSFQLVFDGDSSNAGAVSSVVTREINKETSVIAVSSPSSAGTYYTDGSISVAGNLKTDDDEVISGASVLVKLGSTILTTLTTDSNGSFTGSISVSLLSTGSNTLKFLFESNTYYATSYQDVIITVNDVSLTLESDKSILSYTDEQQTPGSQVATLTATYNGTNVTGKNVTMKVYKESDDSLIETLQVTDNNDGTYTASYTSGGVGDIYIKAECNLVSKTYSIKDVYFYDSLTTNKNKYEVTTGSMSLTYGSNGLTAKGTVLSDSFATRNDLTLPSNDYKVSYVLSDFTYGTGGGVTEIGFEDVTVSQTANGIYLRKLGGGATSSTTSATTGDVISLEITGTTIKTVKLYVNDELRTTLTDVAQTQTHRLKTYQNRSTTFKELIIEPL